MIPVPVVFAETAPSADPARSPFFMMGMMAIMFAILYFMMIRPQKRREKEHKEMIAGIQSGCRVLLTSGIIGQVTNVKENTLIIRIAESTKIETVRSAVSQVLEKDEMPGKVEPAHHRKGI